MSRGQKNIVTKLTSWVGSVHSLILHTIVFAAFFILSFAGFLSWDLMFLILTTIVSLEAIYLAILIEMTVNQQSKELEEVSEDVEDIQEDIQEISEDVDEIQEDIEEIQEEDEPQAEASPPNGVTLESVTHDLERLLADLEQLKKAK